jgi:hypothetical protein
MGSVSSVKRVWGNKMIEDFATGLGSQGDMIKGVWRMRASSLCSASALAIGRSMRRFVLPGLGIAISMSAIPENQLRAFALRQDVGAVVEAADRIQDIWPQSEAQALEAQSGHIPLNVVLPSSDAQDLLVPHASMGASNSAGPHYAWPVRPAKKSDTARPLATGLPPKRGDSPDEPIAFWRGESGEHPRSSSIVAGASISPLRSPEGSVPLLAEEVSQSGANPQIVRAQTTVPRVSDNLQSGFPAGIESNGLASDGHHGLIAPNPRADQSSLLLRQLEPGSAAKNIVPEAPSAATFPKISSQSVGPLPEEPTRSSSSQLSGAHDAIKMAELASPVSEEHFALVSPTSPTTTSGHTEPGEAGLASSPRPQSALVGTGPASRQVSLGTLEQGQARDVQHNTSPPRSALATGSINDGAGDAVIEKDGIKLVKIGAIVEMLSGGFDELDLIRIRSSDARNTYLPLDALRRAGIPVAYAEGNEALELEPGFVQSSGNAPGASGAGLGRSSGSSGMASSESLAASASVGFDSNPFLSAVEDRQVASLRLQISPSITRENERSSLRLTGRAEHIEYLGKFRSLQNFGADLSGSHRLTERLEANAGFLFRSDIQATDLTNPLSTDGGAVPDTPGLPVGNDVTILGQRQRRTQYGADGGLTFTPSDRDQIRWVTVWRSDRFETAGLSDSDFFSQQLRYSRQVNENLAIGAVVEGSIINFRNGSFGDAQTITPQALIVWSLSPRVKASGSVGMALTRIETATGNETTQALAGNLSLCFEAELSNLCVDGSRQVLPSAIGGARVQTSAGLSYSLRLSERDRLQMGGNYSTASAPLASFGGDFESINAFARYERDISERMRFFVSGGYLDTSGDNALEATNFQAVAGISIKFGNGK